MTGPVTPGGLSVQRFLARHWQKQASLTRGAFPGFAGLFSRAELLTMACRDDVESRLVLRAGAAWTMTQGPFSRANFRNLPDKGWTLLVQGVNLVSDAADALLRQFAFLPYARLDDLMVSYAAPEGGVGPHIDSYDVFLLQGSGHRRWRWGRQQDQSLRPDLPLKILRRFTPTEDAVLAPGDMLYLPPAFAHDGVAVDECTTYSIGFRASANSELAQAFLDFLRDQVALPGRYADPGRRHSSEPARVDGHLQRHAVATLAAVRWDRAMVAGFLGTFLSEPKANVVFTPPGRVLTTAAFAALATRRGLRLDRQTIWLYDDDALYVNGEALPWPAGARKTLSALANARALSPAAATKLSPAQRTLVHTFYRHGYLHAA